MSQCGIVFVSAPECRDIETVLYDCTYVFSVLCSKFQYVKAMVARRSSKMIMVAYEYTYQDHEYIIRTMDTKHKQCGMAFLLQAAHKIAVSFPKTFIISCLGK